MLEKTAGFTALIAEFAQDRMTAAIDHLRQTHALWRARGAERVLLSGLDERMLRDIGLTKVDVWREVNKPFWRP